MAWTRKGKAKSRGTATPAVPLEVDEQEAFLDYLKGLPYPWCEIWFSVPNDSRRGFVAQRLAKRLGIRRGIPDLIIPISVDPYYGLAIEMKRVKGSTTTQDQLDWQRRLREQGWKAEIVKGCDAAIIVLENYRNGN